MRPEDLLARLEAGYEYDPMYGRLCNERDQLKAENAKLREQIHWLKQGDILHVLTDQEYIDQCERERLMQVSIDALDKENAKLRELVSSVHMRYVGTLNECESLNEGLIYEYSGSVEADVAKSRAKFKADRHRFDAALRELGVEVDA